MFEWVVVVLFFCVFAWLFWLQFRVDLLEDSVDDAWYESRADSHCSLHGEKVNWKDGGGDSE